MKLQISLAIFFVGIVLTSEKEQKDKKSIQKSEKSKRGLFDLGYSHGFDSFEGLNQGFHGHEDFHKGHETYDYKEIKVPIPHPYPVPIEKKVPVPYPVKVPVYVEHPVPVPVIKPYPVPVEKPVLYPVEKHVPVPVKVPFKVPYPVKVPVAVEKPYPVPVIKKVPFPVKKPYIVEKEVPVFVKEHHHDSFDHGYGLGFSSFDHHF